MADVRGGERAPTAHFPPSSYWSSTERLNFDDLLERFGTDWVSIANHMGTKSETMVKNRYSRLIEDGHEDIVARAKDAGDRRRRDREFERPPASHSEDVYSDTSLFVSGIHPSLSDHDLTRLFETYGQVEQCKITIDPHTMDFRGVGFVKMFTAAEAEAAIEALQGKVFQGRTLSVEKPRLTRPRTPEPGKYYDPREHEPSVRSKGIWTPKHPPALVPQIQRKRLESSDKAAQVANAARIGSTGLVNSFQRPKIPMKRTIAEDCSSERRNRRNLLICLSSESDRKFLEISDHAYPRKRARLPDAVISNQRIKSTKPGPEQWSSHRTRE